MTNRSPALVAVYSIISFGFYAIYWLVTTKTEMNESAGTDIPTGWFLLIPFVNIWWYWKYCEGVEKTTNGKLTGPVAFLLLLFLSIIGMAIIQSKFNLDAEPAAVAA